MSLNLVTRSPMTLDEALGELRTMGCTVVPSDGSESVNVRDILGNQLCLTEDRMPETCEDLEATSIKRLKNEIRIRLFEIRSGATYVLAKAYCLSDNNPEWMAETLGMATEGEDDYDAIMEAFYSDVVVSDPDDDD